MAREINSYFSKPLMLPSPLNSPKIPLKTYKRKSISLGYPLVDYKRTFYSMRTNKILA